MVARATWIEAKANEALLKTGQMRPPTDLDLVAAHYGISVLRGERAAGVVAHFDATMNEIVLGEYDRWPFAHELGHALLLHGNVACYSGASASDMPIEEVDVGVPFEAEANRFARHLLVPRDWLQAAMDRGGKVPDLARLFAVSEKVIWLAMDGYKQL
jgi:IrrE N-terminal-like domain